MASAAKKTIAIIGATATGKSNFALRLAQTIGGEVVSVDSGAVYREMDIGTAKPAAADRRRIRHHLVNICNPDDAYNVGRFCQDAAAAVADICQRGKTPILVGGSMMYFNAWYRGLAAIPPVPAATTQQVADEIATGGLPAAYRALQKCDPAASAGIAANDSQRIARALAVARATGKPLSHWQQQQPAVAGAPAIHTILFFPQNRATLRRRIEQRLDAMWASGLLEETKYLLVQWSLADAAPPLRLAGYRQAVAHLRGALSHLQMRQSAYFASCQLAKRQLTWLARWLPAAESVVDPFAFCEQTLLEPLAQTHAPSPS